MYEKEEIIEDYIKEELYDIPNILNNELSLNGMNFQLRKEFDFIKGNLIYDKRINSNQQKIREIGENISSTI